MKYCIFLGQAHSSVERAGLFGGVKFRHLEVDEKNKLRGDTFAEAIRKDKEQGFIPFYVSLAYSDTSLSIKCPITFIFYFFKESNKIAVKKFSICNK